MLMHPRGWVFVGLVIGLGLRWGFDLALNGTLFGQIAGGILLMLIGLFLLLLIVS